MAAIGRLPPDRRLLIAIDGVDGAGKTTFADALADRIDRRVIRASLDAFHNPEEIRYSRGRDSPEGFYLDSFDLDALMLLLLRPFAAGEPFCRRVFDYRSNRRVPKVMEDAPADAALVLDGLFLHRPELRHWWDLSVLLDVPPATAGQRLLKRDGRIPHQRYVRGQQLYFADAKPREHASLVLPW